MTAHNFEGKHAVEGLESLGFLVQKVAGSYRSSTSGGDEYSRCQSVPILNQGRTRQLCP